MRLTHVLQLALPEGASTGRLSTCTIPLTPDPRRPLPISFDQRRHLEAGDRAGSWMALSFRLPGPVEREAIGRAWAAVVARHGTLRTVVSADADGLTLHEATPGEPEWQEHPQVGDPRAALRAALDAACRPFGAPSHRVALLEISDQPPMVVIASDHSHLDMWSLLVLARDLIEALGGDALGDGGPLGDAPAFAEHTRLLEAAPPAPADVTAQWERIMADGGGLMPVFPLPLGDLSSPRDEIVVVRDVLDADGYARLGARADAAGVRVAALAVSLLTEVTRRVAGAPLRAVFPVHSRFEPRWHEGVGWFITNAVIYCDADDPASGAAAVKRALALGSHPLAPILAPWGGMPATPGMFAVSWLDARRIPIEVPGATEVQWVSAATQTDGVMIWFLAGDDGLHLRIRFPDTPEARVHVGRWLDAVTAALQEAARIGLRGVVTPVA